MSPRVTTFDKPAVLAAALALVREDGWEALTARSIALGLGASVAPVYSTYGSMEALERAVLKEARRILDEKMAAAYSDDAFLNIGVGMTVFARDEANLFRALFHTRHPYPDIVRAVFASILRSMKADRTLRLLSDASLERLLGNLRTFTWGLAASIIYGQEADPSTAGIIRRLRDAGNMMIFGELSGLADSNSRESEREWNRIIKEKNITLPTSPDAPRPRAKREKKEKR